MVLAGSVALAALLWGIMFGLKWGNFWLSMTLAATTLALIALWRQRRLLARLFAFRRSHIAVGIVAAVVLYAVFFLGDRISGLLFNFATAQVNGIYGMKAQMPPATIALLLFFVVGPAEEIYWRGFVQERLGRRYGDFAGWLGGTLVYAGVHLWAWNFMLFMAALFCGLFWGAVFWRWKSLWPGIISHALWDVTIFILLPVR